MNYALDAVKDFPTTILMKVKSQHLSDYKKPIVSSWTH